MKKLMTKLPKPWAVWGINQHKFETGLDDSFNGARAAFIRSNKHETIAIEPAEAADFAMIYQTFGAHSFRGKRLRFSAFLRAKEVQGAGGLRVTVMDVNRVELAQDDMFDRPIRGNVGWTYCEVIIDVPVEARFINIGFHLIGPGKLWCAGLKNDEVGKDLPTTDRYAADSWHTVHSAAPQNLDFMSLEGVIRGDGETIANWPEAWQLNADLTDRYSAGIDPELRLEGQRVLRIQSLKSPLVDTFRVQQTFSAHNYRGKKLQFAFQKMVIDAEDAAFGWIATYGWRNHRYAFSCDERPYGDTNGKWQQQRLVIDVHPQTRLIKIGFELEGAGSLRIADVQLTEVPGDTAATPSGRQKPENLDFEH